MVKNHDLSRAWSRGIRELKQHLGSSGNKLTELAAVRHLFDDV